MDCQPWPDPCDSVAWLDAAASGRLPSCPPGAIIAALRAQMRIGHRPAADALASFLSDETIRRLRRMIGTNHRDRGEPMVERAHYELMTAAIDPSHADHDGLVEAFAVRLRFRALDAIRVERRHDWRHPSYDATPGGLATVEAKRAGGIAQTVQAEHLLTRTADPRKRLAFRHYAESWSCRSPPASAAAKGLQEIIGRLRGHA